MKKKESWIIVTNKKTYLLLAIAACIILYLIKAAISTFSLKTMLVADFLGELMVCVLIALICIYLSSGLTPIPTCTIRIIRSREIKYDR